MRRTRLRRLARPFTTLTTAAALLAAAPAWGAVAKAQVPHPAVGGAAGVPATVQMTPDQALAKARSTGSAVPVTGSTTPTDTLTANPDGSFTLNHALAPVRKLVAGSWADLDATLIANPDGTVSPKVTASPVSLSGGGTGALATLGSPVRSLSLTLPFALPKPTLSGATATYASVLPGVDLTVTTDTQGGLSEVLVVHNATAAANPALSTLAMATRSTGVTVHADAAGNIAALNTAGQAAITAPAPTMWDSASSPAPAAAVTDPTTGTAVDAESGMPVSSSAAAPGEGAHTAPVGTAISNGAINLTPDKTLLTAGSTVWPVYIDPTFAQTGSVENSWTTVEGYYPDYGFWKTSGNLKVGYCGWSGCNYDVNRSFVDEQVPTQLWGATISSSQINFLENWSPSCTPTPVQLWTTSSISQNTTYSHQPTWLAQVGSAQSVAYGYDSSCSAHGVGWDITAVMQSAADNHHTDQAFGLMAGDETDKYGWKQFSNQVTVSTKYNHAPYTPSALTTSPATTCNGTTTVGDGAVALYAQLSDPDGGTVGATFTLWNTAAGPNTPVGGPTNPTSLFVSSGSTAVFIVPEANLKASAGTTITNFSWHVQATDYSMTSSWSATCSFNFDPTRQGAPTVPQPNGAMVGTPVSIAVTPPPTGTTPSSYLYQLNGTAPQTVTADIHGNATITVTPSRTTNTVTVTSVSAGGNIGDTATTIFPATTAATQGPNDMTGDGIPDLLTVGGVNGLPSGIWLAPGQAAAGGTAGTGQVRTAATNIGIYGNGTDGNNSASSFDGAQILTGHFSGTGLNDVLAYYPDGAHPNIPGGTATMLFGNGDGSPLQAQNSGNRATIQAGTLSDGTEPLQLANAGNASGLNLAYPDLIGVAGTTGNYYLNYYPNSNGVGLYNQIDPLTNPAPDGTMNWNNWTIATAVMGSGTSSSTAMFLWNKSTGALYLWTNLDASSVISNTSSLMNANKYQIASNWNPGSTLSLQAADINGDGTPDLWTVGANGATTAWLVTGLTGTPAITAQNSQTLQTAAHTWLLNDQSTAGTAYGTATDITGGLSAAAVAGVTGNTGDLFDPDARFNGSTGDAATSTPAVNVASDFTISTWAKPDSVSGTLASQDGAHGSGFILYPDTASNKWMFCMGTSDTNTWSYDCIAGGTVQLGVWTQITASYKAATGMMTLYIDGVNTALGTHTPVAGYTGAFHIGSYQNSGNRTNFYNGQIADLQTWNQVVPPATPDSPDGYFVPLAPARILDTRSGTGGVTGPITSNSAFNFAATGVGGLPSSGVTAVAMTITTVSATNPGFVTVYPDLAPQSVTSTVNYRPSLTITNSAIVPLGTDGKIAMASKGASVQIIADVTGYFTTNSTTTGASTYSPVAPARILDTRSGVGAPASKLGSGASIPLAIAGHAGIASSGVTAVAINLTTVNSAGSGSLNAYADGATAPQTTNISYASGVAIGAMSIVPVGTDGSIRIYNPGGYSTDVIGDVIGYFTGGTAGQKYHTLNATRLYDSRLSGGALAAGATLSYTQNVVNAVNPTLIINITATQQAGGGNLTAYPNGGSTAGTSTINYTTAPADIADAFLAQTSNNAFNVSNIGSSVQIVIDANGYFANF